MHGTIVQIHLHWNLLKTLPHSLDLPLPSQLLSLPTPINFPFCPIPVTKHCWRNCSKVLTDSVTNLGFLDSFVSLVWQWSFGSFLSATTPLCVEVIPNFYHSLTLSSINTNPLALSKWASFLLHREHGGNK